MKGPLADEHEGLTRSEHELAAENRRLTVRCLALEKRQEAWLAQFVAVLRLHSSLRRKDVMKAIEEILACLVGCEEAALYEREANALRPVAGFGVDPGRLPEVRIGEGVTGRAAAEGRVRLAGPDSAGDDVAACVPLLLEGRVTGALALFRLLEQKPELNDGDRQLLELLSIHAAVALEASRE